MNSNRLYMHRSLSDNVNMVFDFVGENWRKLLKMMIYFLLPFSVLIGIALSSIQRGNDTLLSPTTYVVSGALFVAGCAVVTALVILLVKWSEAHNGTLDGCEVGTMWRMLPRSALKCLGVIVLWTPLMVLACFLVVIPIIGWAAILAVLPIYLLCPIMLLEPGSGSLLDVASRAFSLGFKKWGRLILTTLIMGVVAVLINNAITFPLAIYKVVDSVFWTRGGATDTVFKSFVVDMMFYIICVAESFMIFVETGLFVLAMTYHYGSVATEVEDIGLERDIDNFPNLQ